MSEPAPQDPSTEHAHARLHRFVLPFWLERQVDPTSPDFSPAPAAQASQPVNTTHRNWTLIGNLGSWRRALVDPRGLVTPRDGGWSLDWWVGAEDRWHLPSRDAAVRQRLVDEAPVVETAMRVPGGDVVHRAYGARVADREHVVVEIENATAVPVAIALAIRPFHAHGASVVERIALDEGGRLVSIDGEPSLWLPKRPARAAVGSRAGGDCFDVVSDGEASEGAIAALQAGIGDEDGAAQAAFVYPLAHTATLRVALPLDGPAPTGRRAGGRRRATTAPATAIVDKGDLPEAARVASGWRTQGARGLRVELPDQRLQEAVESCRRHLLLVHGGEDLVTVPSVPMDFGAAVGVLGALDDWGYHDEVDQVLSTWSERQHPDGSFRSGAAGNDATCATAAAMHALADHWRMTGTLDDPDSVSMLVARAGRSIEKLLAPRRRTASAEPLSPRAGVWSLQGLADVGALLDVAGQPDAANAVSSAAERLHESVSRAVAETAGVIAPSANRLLDGSIVDSLDVLNLPVVRMAAGGNRSRWAVAGAEQTLELIARDCVADDAVLLAEGPAGSSARHTAMLGRAELAVGGAPHTRLAWLLAHASSTWVWPEAQHQVRGGGTVGAGHDGIAIAWFLRFVRDLLVRSDGDDGLALCSVWPDAWLGQSLEVHDAPTRHGRLSFAIRWHGERPALLWQLEPGEVSPAGVRLVVPALDRTWSTTELAGEALLSVPVSVTDRVIDAGELEGESFA